LLHAFGPEIALYDTRLNNTIILYNISYYGSRISDDIDLIEAQIKSMAENMEIGDSPQRRVS